MGYTFVFKRKEKKYQLTEAQWQALWQDIGDRLCPDKYGRTQICNIYYDTPARDLLRRSIEKPVFKEKLRLRSYGVPTADSTVFLEIKRKYKGVVYKRRADMTLRQAEAFLAVGQKPGADTQILRELDYFLQQYKPEPFIFLAYEREAYLQKEDNAVRLTVDRNICSRTTELDLSAGSHGQPLLPPDTCLLEIKINGAMPLWLSAALAKHKIYPRSFSKCGRVYQQLLELEFAEQE